MNPFDRELGKERFAGAAKLQHEPGVPEKAPSVSHWPRAPFRVPEGRQHRLSVGDLGGPSSCPEQGGPTQDGGRRSPQPLGGGEGGLPRATGGTAGWLGGTAPHRVWSAQIPGSGSNLACPVRLSPDTRGPATKMPRQNNLAVDGWPGRSTRSVGARRAQAALPTGRSCRQGRERPGGFQGRGFTLTRVTSSLLRCPAGASGPSSSSASRLLCLPNGPRAHHTPQMAASQAKTRRRPVTAWLAGRRNQGPSLPARALHHTQACPQASGSAPAEQEHAHLRVGTGTRPQSCVTRPHSPLHPGLRRVRPGLPGPSLPRASSPREAWGGASVGGTI